MNNVQTPAPAPVVTPSSPNPPFGGNALSDYWNKYYGVIRPQPTTTTAKKLPVESPQTVTEPPVDSAPPSSISPQPAGLNEEEKLMFELVNQERAKAGLAVFTIDWRLVNLAKQKSQDMYEKNYFSHISPTYGSALDMEKRAGISARVMGAENIAKAATTRRAHELFMNSSGHRANILNSLHTVIGIGIVKTPGGVVVTQLFLGN